VWALGVVVGAELICCEVIAGDKGVIETGQGVNVLHHSGRSVEDRKMVSKELLRPTAHLVYVPGVLKNLLHCRTVTKPEEVLPNQVLAADANSPPSSGCFANKGMVMLFTFKAPARVKFDGP
jgi:hypothetical protein